MTVYRSPSVTEILEEIRQQGGKVRLINDRLQVEMPADKLASLRETIAAQKAEIVAILRDADAAWFEALALRDRLDKGLRMLTGMEERGEAWSDTYTRAHGVFVDLLCAYEGACTRAQAGPHGGLA